MAVSIRSGLAALYLSRNVGFTRSSPDPGKIVAASKSLGDAKATPGRRGRAFWTWLEDYDQVHRPAAYVIWSRINESSTDVAYEQVGLTFVAEMFADEVQVRIHKGNDGIIRHVMGTEYPHHFSGMQAWARHNGHDRTNADAVYAAVLWNWGRSQIKGVSP